jgi:hypothetical protein
VIITHTSYSSNRKVLSRVHKSLRRLGRESSPYFIVSFSKFHFNIDKIQRHGNGLSLQVFTLKLCTMISIRTRDILGEYCTIFRADIILRRYVWNKSVRKYFTQNTPINNEIFLIWNLLTFLKPQFTPRHLYQHSPVKLCCKPKSQTLTFNSLTADKVESQVLVVSTVEV